MREEQRARLGVVAYLASTAIAAVRQRCCEVCGLSAVWFVSGGGHAEPEMGQRELVPPWIG